MAFEFPHTEVLEIDLEPRQIKEPPSNCCFIRHDIDLGLSQFHGKYDFVHCRFAGHGMKDHTAAMRGAIKCLRPRGYILFLDHNGATVEDGSAIYKAATSANPEWSWYQRAFMLVICGSSKLGNDNDQSYENFRKGFWEFDGCDPSRCGALEGAGPIGTWAVSEDPVEE
ncbi:hypothetical protein CPB86DRAFT_746133, partial [Serendipita vermifera]